MPWSLTRSAIMLTGQVPRVWYLVWAPPSRDARVGVGVVQDFGHRLPVGPLGRVEGELGAQPLVDGEVEHGVHGVLAHHLGQLGDVLALVLQVASSRTSTTRILDHSEAASAAPPWPA